MEQTIYQDGIIPSLTHLIPVWWILKLNSCTGTFSQKTTISGQVQSGLPGASSKFCILKSRWVLEWILNHYAQGIVYFLLRNQKLPFFRTRGFFQLRS